MSAVSTDAAGLTSLSCRHSVNEILALLDHPTKIVHGCGIAIGVEPRRLLSVLPIGPVLVDRTTLPRRQTRAP